MHFNYMHSYIKQILLIFFIFINKDSNNYFLKNECIFFENNELIIFNVQNLTQG